MRKPIFLLALLLGHCALLKTPAYADGSGVSIAQLLNMAAQGPEVKAARSSAEEFRAKEASARRQTYIPKLVAGFGYTRLLTDQALRLPPLGGTAIPPIKLGSDLLSGSVTLQQAFFDPANMLYDVPASERMTAAASLKSSRQVKETQAKAVDYYLRALELRARRRALEKYAANLKDRLREIRRIYELGGMGEADLLKIKLGIDDAAQGIRDLQKGEDHLADSIASLTGESAPIVPNDLPEELPRSSDCSGDSQPVDREDIRALDKEMEALGLSKKARKAEYLPKVHGFLRHGYTNLDLVTKSNYDLAGVQLSWSLFDGGAGLAAARAAAAQRHALEQKRALTISLSHADLSESRAALDIKRQEYEERRRSISEARTVADLEFKRLGSGKTTINNLIDAEDMLKDRTEKASLSMVNWYQAWFRCQSASGSDLAAP
ncbi:MAG: TolC family protein [Elusimicrobia bacterium]|nr:TolC family protein [Elusimicrobiota bacterium]